MTYPAAPTTIRHRIIGVTMLMAFILYLDRICMGEIDPGELWIGYHNVPKDWNFPRAHHLRVSVAAFVENVGR